MRKGIGLVEAAIVIWICGALAMIGASTVKRNHEKKYGRVDTQITTGNRGIGAGGNGFQTVNK